MKYEITKGSEKDFEGAPESATVRITETGFENEGTIFADKFENGSKRNHYATGDYDSYIADVSNWTIIAERRPITEQAWVGEGLPPVGVECEIFITNNKEWVPVEIFAHHKGVVYGMASGRRIANSEFESDFRPIRSPEDVVRDEAIEQMISILNEGTSTQNDARDIYDAIAAGKIPGVKLE